MNDATDDSSEPDHDLVVAIATFKRPDRLRETLSLVGEQLADLVAQGGVRHAEILVVDNDPAESARGVVAVGYHGTPTRYVAEAKPGIPHVRNRALDESRDFRLLAFIDDDEVPLEGWIRSLVDVWRRFDHPTAVMGRVVSIFAADVDPWVLESGLFQRPERPTGTELDAAATGNLLLDLDQVRAADVRFDGRIGLGGGSDTMFSKTLKRRGARLVWCNESVAEDTVELERQTRAWALKRAYSHGNVAVLVKVRLEESTAGRLKQRVGGAVGGTARIVVGAGRALLGGLSRSMRHDARGRRLMHRGAGMVAAAITASGYAAYSRVSTTPSA